MFFDQCSYSEPTKIYCLSIYGLYKRAHHARKERLSQISCSEGHTINQESSLARYNSCKAVDPMDWRKNADHRGEQSWKGWKCQLCWNLILCKINQLQTDCYLIPVLEWNASFTPALQHMYYSTQLLYPETSKCSKHKWQQQASLHENTAHSSTRCFGNKFPRDPVEYLHMQQKEAASLLLHSIWFPSTVWWARRHTCTKLASV